MKIAVISMNFNNIYWNVGAILHSYAMQEFLNLNYPSDEVEVLDYLANFRRSRGLPVTLSYVMDLKPKAALYYFFLNAFNSQKKKCNTRFVKEHMSTSKIEYNYYDFDKKPFDYDIIISESDVSWGNGIYRDKQFDKAYYLNHDNMKNAKRIAYAVDGQYKLTEKEKPIFERYFNNIDHVAVRNKTIQKMIKTELDKEVPVVLDPVFLLEKNFYKEKIGEPIYKEKYILCYSPLPRMKDKLFTEAIELAKRENKKLVIFPGKSLKHRKYHEKKYLSPFNFLNLIFHADKVLTDSFHAICFSIIFEKDFYAFSRTTNPTKIIEILEQFRISERFVGQEYKKLPKVNYQEVKKILHGLKIQSEKWFIDALKNN